MDFNGISPASEVWVETVTPQGRSYFYHLRTRETKWAKPDNVLVIKQEDLPKLAEKLGVQSASAGASANAAGSSDNSAGGVNGIAANQSANILGNNLQSQQMLGNAVSQPMTTPLAAAPNMMQAGAPGVAGVPQQHLYNAGVTPQVAGRPPWMPPSSLASVPPGGGGFLPPPLLFGNPATTMASQVPGGFGPQQMMAGGMFPPGAPMMMQQQGMMPPHMLMPPTMMPFMPFMMPQQAQKPMVSANDWTEYKTPDNRPYWYNSKTSKSSWEKPPEVAEAEKLQKTAAPVKKAENDKTAETAAAVATTTTTEKPKPKPISTKAVPGTAWCVVWTNDGKHFFYNPTTKSSVWKLPLDLATNPDVDGIVARGPTVQTSTTSAASAASSTTTENADAVKKVTDAARNDTKASDSPLSGANKPTLTSPAANSTPVTAAADTTTATNTATLMLKADTREGAIAAERNAAKERESIPLPERIERFQKLLEEKGVDPLSTWEKELNKIVFDSRYLLINSKERKDAFDSYCSKKVEFVKEEKRRKQKQREEAFFQMIRENKVTSRMKFADFRSKFARDERLLAIDRYSERESLFNKFIKDQREQEETERREKAENSKKEFVELLRSLDGLHRKSEWSEVKKRIAADSRYNAVESSSRREDYFDDYRRTLDKKPKRKPSPGEIMTDEDDEDAAKSVASGEVGDDGDKTKRQRKNRTSTDRRSAEKSSSSKSKKRAYEDEKSKTKSNRRDVKRSRDNSVVNVDDVDREDVDEDDRDAADVDGSVRRHRSSTATTTHRRKEYDRDDRRGRDSSKRTYRRSGSRSGGHERYKPEDDAADDSKYSGRRDKKASSKHAGRRDRRSISDDDENIRSSLVDGRDRSFGDSSKKAPSGRRIRNDDADDLSDDDAANDIVRRHDIRNGSNRTVVDSRKRHRSKSPVDLIDVKYNKRAKESGKSSLKRSSTLSPVDEENDEIKPEDNKDVKRIGAKKRKSNVSDDEADDSRVAVKAEENAAGDDDEAHISKYALQKRVADDLKTVLKSGKVKSENRSNDVDNDGDDDENEQTHTTRIKDEDDADDEDDRAVAAAEAERQARFDASLRKRREEVEQKMSSINMETQRERQQSKLNEARAAYQQLLNDNIRHTEYDFHDARKKLKKSKNYDELISGILDKAERESLFDAHIAALKEKKKERFFALLREHNVQIDSKWSQVQPQIMDDARYEKFSSSERKREKAFREYRDQVLHKEARAEFRQMLRESAVMRFSLTQPDNNNNNSGVASSTTNSSSSTGGGGVNNKMLEKLLSKDRDAWLELQVQLEDDPRYMRMGLVDEHERREILQDYVIELAKRAVSGSGAPIQQQ